MRILYFQLEYLFANILNNKDLEYISESVNSGRNYSHSGIRMN
jgi:hypothetical protein